MKNVYEQIQSWAGLSFSLVEKYESETVSDNSNFVVTEQQVIGCDTSLSSPSVNVKVIQNGYIKLNPEDAKIHGSDRLDCTAYKNYSLIKDGKIKVPSVMINGKEVSVMSPKKVNASMWQLESVLEDINKNKASLKGLESNDPKAPDLTPEWQKKYGIKNGTFNPPYVASKGGSGAKTVYPKVKGASVPSVNAVNKKLDAGKKLNLMESLVNDGKHIPLEKRTEFKNKIQELSIKFSEMYISMFNSNSF